MTGEVSAQEMDDVFDDEPEAEQVEEVEETESKGEVEAEEEIEEVEEKAEDQEEETEEETSEPPSEEQKQVPLAAFLEVRKQLKQTKEQLEQLQGQQQPQLGEKPDPIDDPEGYEKWVENKVALEYQQKQQQQWAEKAEAAREKAMMEHADYLEMEKAFYVLANTYDNNLVNEMMNAEDPANFAYGKAKEYIQTLTPQNVLSEKMPKEPPKTPKMPNLAKATADAPNSEAPEKDDWDSTIGEDAY